MMFNKTFITGGDINYLPLIEVLVESIKEYLTKSDLIVYTFNCDYKIEGVETRRLNLPINNFPNQSNKKYINLAWKDNSLYWAKYYATLDAFKDYEFVSWIDGDAFATEYINEIWDYTDYCKSNNQPLFMTYFGTDVNTWNHNFGLKLEGGYGAEAAYIFGAERNPNNKIIATGLYLSHISHRVFFEECINLWYESMKTDCWVYCDDNAYSEERLTNVYTWMSKTKGFLPITWINYLNEEKNYYFNDKIRSFLNKETDVIYNSDTKHPLMIHQFPNKKDMMNMYNAYKQTPDKIMFVAHPDDELIFGGLSLLEENNWKVVCLTNKNNNIRRREFEKSMRDFSVPVFEIYDLEDDINKELNNDELTKIISNELNKQKWSKVVTHNNIGEYGHPHHKQIHDKVKEILNDDELLWVFDKDENYNNYDHIREKTNIFFNRYESQKGIFEQLKNMDGSWFIDKFKNTNYIEHGIIKQYNNSSYKNDKFIHCFNK